jgi:hypothetical protein
MKIFVAAFAVVVPGYVHLGRMSATGLPDFSWYMIMIPKPEIMYPVNTKCKKWS